MPVRFDTAVLPGLKPLVLQALSAPEYAAGTAGIDRRPAGPGAAGAGGATGHGRGRDRPLGATRSRGGPCPPAAILGVGLDRRAGSRAYLLDGDVDGVDVALAGDALYHPSVAAPYRLSAP